MTKYDYRILSTNNLPIVGNGDNIESQLKKLGEDGWELVAVKHSQPFSINFLIFSTTKIHNEKTFYLKRRVVLKRR